MGSAQDTVISRLIENLSTNDSATIQQTQILLKSYGASAIPFLKDALESGDKLTQINAAKTLITIEDPSVLPILESLLGGSNLMLSEIAVKGLRGYGIEAVPYFLRALDHCHPLIQIKVVTAFEVFHTPEVIPALMELLPRAEAGSLRYTIIQTLGVLGDPSAVDLIRQYADDPDRHVRNRVQTALERLGG